MEQKRLKIAFVNQPWVMAVPPVQGGSIAIWIYEVARRLAKSCDVVVYGNGNFSEQLSAKHCVFTESRCDEGVLYRYFWMGLDSRLLKIFNRFTRFFAPKRPFFSSKLYYFGYSLQIAKDLRRQKCDIVHIPNFSQFVPIIRAFNPQIKIVLNMHCEWLTQLDRKMVITRLKKTDLTVGCSQYITNKIRLKFPEHAQRCETIYNGIDVNNFSHADNNINPKENKIKRLLFVGRISPEKGVHVLLDAFPKIVEQYPQVHLEIIGTISATTSNYAFLVAVSDDPNVLDLAKFYQGDYHAFLHSKLSPEVASRVSFTGYIPHSQLTDYYRNADILINPSLSESFGRSLIEAMACEVPVVASRVGGMTEIVGEKIAGLLVEPGEPATLADAILHLLKNDDLREAMGAEGRKRVIENFSWNRITEELLFQYQKIV